MINNLVLIGNLGTDPKIGDGEKWASLFILSNESYKDKDGEWQEITTAISGFCRGYNVAKCQKLSKGDKVVVVGSIKNNTKEGKEREMFIDIKTIKSLTPKPVEATEAATGSSKEEDPDDLPF